MLQIISIITLIVGFISLLVSIASGIHVVHRKRFMDERHSQIKEEFYSIADIYTSMHAINLPTNTFHEISASNESHDYTKNFTEAQYGISESMKYFVVPEFIDKALEFTDLKLVRERLKNKKVLSTDFIGRLHGWLRATFITVNADENGYPIDVIFAIRNIEEDKRAEERLKYKANNDELTGFLNRHAYEEDIQLLRHEYKENLVYVSIDVNGLKNVNDNFGHEAGDELLKGTAYCIAEAFSEYGKSYRTGGDEFVVILSATSEELEKIQSDFRELVSGWKGKIVNELAVSCGYVERNDNEAFDIQDIANLADQRMYKDKAIYYAKKGIDRRGQQDAYAALCNSYTKILKINLTENSFNIIQMNDSEKNALFGYSEILSKWMQDFAASGQVHPEDKEEFLKNTDLEFLRKYFKAGNTHFCFHYRRKISEKWTKVMMELMPAREYDDQNQFIYMFIKNIQR